MKVSFFDLKRLYRLTEHDIDRAIRHTLESGHYILGQMGSTFESDMKMQLVGKTEGYVVGCNSGTDALILPLLALGIGPGDEVLAPSHTAIPTITAIRSTGATPRFVDVDENTWLICLEDLKNNLSPKTKAIIAVHLYGNLVDIFALKEVLNKAGYGHIPVIEDVAQAHGSSLHHKGIDHQAGTMGDYGSYSFYPTKNIGALGDAGAIFVKSQDKADQLKCLRNYGQKDRYNAVVQRGLNSRLDEIQAAILSSRLKYFDKWNEKKANLYSRYQTEFQSLPLQFQKLTIGVKPNWHLGVIRLPENVSREHFINALNEKGVQTLIHYPLPCHKQMAFKDYADRNLPKTEALAEKIVSLPLNPVLMPEEVEHVIHEVKSFFKTN